MSTNQFEQVCGNNCGCVLNENKTIYIMAPPDGEDQVWCEDCTNDLWEELGRKGWTRDGEGYTCLDNGCDEDDCAEGCKCECTDCQRNRSTGEESEEE